jgi:hypothetical protein
MLNIDLKPTFTRTATFQIPSSTSFVEQSCVVTFEALDIPTFAAFELGDPLQVKGFLERVVVGLDELVDKGGAAVDYSDAVRDQLIRQDWGRKGLVDAYLRGRARAAEGN